MARVIVHPVVEELLIQHHNCELGQYVDDLKLYKQDMDMA